MNANNPSANLRPTRRTARRSSGALVGATEASASLSSLSGLSSLPYGGGTRRMRRPASAADASSRGAGTVREAGLRDAGARDAGPSRQREVHARPAVYTSDGSGMGGAGKIRRTHVSHTGTPRASRPSSGINPVPIPIVVIVLCVIVVAIVTPPVRNYYKAWRDAGVLRVEYDALQEQRKELNAEIERLKSPEGEEEEARNRGYVYPDEEAFVVTDVEERAVADPALVDEAIEEYERDLPWYVKTLDVVLGYSRE